MKLKIEDIRRILAGQELLHVDETTLKEVERCHAFLKGFAEEKIIYGINTGFGPMAQWRVDDKYLTDLQYNIIRSHSTGAGKPLDDICVKAAMIARLGSFIQCRSGIHPEAVVLLQEFVNRDIIPFIPEHGSVGASGDLVQLAHIALCMIGEGKVHYKGEWRASGEVLRECGLKPMSIHIREGLSATNGTSVMTGIAVVNQLHAMNLLRLAVAASVWMNEIAESYDDMISEPLNECRRHEGQQRIAEIMRGIAASSKCLKKREHELYTSAHRDVSVFKDKVQAYYSLRCVPQILGPVLDTLKVAEEVVEDELNSASDNPIVDPETKNVYHGGNFHGDYISLEEDKVKIALVRLTMLMERQLNYLFHHRINDNILPPFLNLGTLGLNYGMQACQFTATSTTAESQTLAMPNYVHSIPCNGDNQDIVSMGTNSALLAKHVVENAYQVAAIHFIALAQATDCLSGRDGTDWRGRLSETTSGWYDEVRRLVETRVDDKPFYEEIEKVTEMMKSKALK